MEPAKLADLKSVGNVPRVPRWWSAASWAVFLLGVLVVLSGLASLGGIAAIARSTASVMVFVILLPAFLCGATNTVLASLCFAPRRDQIMHWMKSRLAAVARASDSDKGPVGHDKNDKRGAIRLRANPKDSADWTVGVSGAFLPKPYHTGGQTDELNFFFQNYIDLIHAETTAARTSAAKMAAAHGGLFVAAIQLYARLAA